MTMQKNTTSLVEMVEECAASESMSLPVFPGVALELNRKMTDENSSISDIAAIIAKDQALAGQMLKLANSAFFAGLNKVRTIRESIMRLGVNQVFNCLVASGHKNFYISRDRFIGQYLKVLWQHALATAKGSQWLLRRIGYGELADEGFLAGLFHDIGKLLLLRVFETIRSQNHDLALTDSFILEVLDSMHVNQGYALMVEWGIPQTYSDVVKRHHDEETADTDSLLLCVRIANRVCAKACISLKPDPTIVVAALPEVQSMSLKEIVLAELEVVIEDALDMEL
ncbi:MAG TPA: HDOD domain-containing protein [Syntrophobacteraceae bacterium]|nr:HDOD domain-containing protein [Syntrophobacteraceae bacterium]